MNEGLLSDIKVLELANVLAGPSVGAMFAELGATVIKLENPQTKGDVTRSWKLSTEEADTDISAYFSCVNWGKKSLALDLSQVEGLNILYQIIPHFDIVLVSYKPGDAEKLGVDYVRLQQLNPKIIYGHITGYGLHNPRSGYDAIIQAEAGFTFINGEKGGKPTKMPVAFMDILAAHQLKEAILIALLQRYKTGKGTYIDVSLLKSGIVSLANQAANWLVATHIPQAMGSDHPTIVPYGTVFETADNKPIVLAVGTDAQFRSLCETLKDSTLSLDERYATNFSRVQNRESLQMILRGLVGKINREELLMELHKRKVPAAGVLNMQEVFEQEEAQSLLLEGKTTHGNQLKGLRTVAFNMKDNTFATILKAPPHFGEHTAEVLQQLLGFSNNIIKSLNDSNVIYDNNYKQ
jgi:crotonobetainyl-CoA:carnitine CoA-transferase CaiB-like acyl-CoA transferase